jgi:hypothetical protein
VAALHSRRQNADVQLYAFDILALDRRGSTRAAAVDAEYQPRAPAGRQLLVVEITMKADSLRPPRFSFDKLGVQCISEPRYDLVLHLKQIGDGFVKTVGP